MAIFGRGYPQQAAVKILRAVSAATQTLSASLYDDSADDVTYGSSVSSTGTLTPGLYDDSDTIYQPIASPGSVSLSPSLFTDDDSQYDTSVSATYELSPSLYDDSDAVYSLSVASIDTLSASIHDDSDSVYSPTLEILGYLLPGLVASDDSIHQPTVQPGDVDVAPTVYDDADVTYAPVASSIDDLLPSAYSDADATHHPVVTQYVALAPTLVSDAGSIPPASVAQQNIIQPPLVVAESLIYVPIDASVYFLLDNLYDDADSVFLPSLSTGPVGMQPSRYVDADVMYTPAVQKQSVHGGGGGGGGGGTVTSDIKYATSFVMDASGLVVALQMQSTTAKTVNTRMMLYADSAGVPGALLGQTSTKSSIVIGTNAYNMVVPVSALIGQKVWIALHTDGNVSWFLTTSTGGSRYNTDLFSDGPSDPFGPSSVDNKKAPVLIVLLDAVNATVSPPLYSDADAFYAPSLGEFNVLPPTVVADTDYFYAAVSVGVVEIDPTKYSDADAFYQPLASVGPVTLLPSLFVDSEEAIIPVIGVGDGNVFPPLLVDADDIGGIVITPMGADLLPSLDGDVDLFHVPVISDVVTIAPPDGFYWDDADPRIDDAFYDATVRAGSVALGPQRWVDVDQYPFADLVRGIGTDRALPGLVGSDDAFYAPSAGSPRRAHRVALSGSGAPSPVVGATAANDRTLSGLSGSQVAISGSARGGIELDGDASGAAVQLEGSDA